MSCSAARPTHHHRRRYLSKRSSQLAAGRQGSTHRRYLRSPGNAVLCVRIDGATDGSRRVRPSCARRQRQPVAVAEHVGLRSALAAVSGTRACQRSSLDCPNTDRVDHPPRPVRHPARSRLIPQQAVQLGPDPASRPVGEAPVVVRKAASRSRGWYPPATGNARSR